MVQELIQPIFVSGMGMSPALASIALLVFRLYDAFIDPLVGWISDNTRSRWGRRKPYILVGTVLTGLWFPVMWHAGEGWSSQHLFLWLLITGLIFYSCFAVWAMPYQSMLLEMTPDYHERTRISSWRSVFGQAGNFLIGWAWYLTQQPFFAGTDDGKIDGRIGAQNLSIFTGILILCIGALPVFFVRERYYKQAANQKKVTLRDNFRWTFQNRPFVITVGFTFFFCTACSIIIGLLFYLRLYYVAGGDAALAAKISGMEATLSAILGFLAVPFFDWLSRRIGKTHTLLIAMVWLFFGIASHWWMFNPRYPWLCALNGAILAPALTGIWQLIPSINGDVVDHDELRTGERREGAFASIFSWVVKASFSIGAGLSGPLVMWCGLDLAKGAAQAESTFLAMRLADVLLGAGALVGAIVLVLRYPLSPTRMEAIRRELEQRRGRV